VSELLPSTAGSGMACEARQPLSRLQPPMRHQSSGLPSTWCHENYSSRHAAWLAVAAQSAVGSQMASHTDPPRRRGGAGVWATLQFRWVQLQYPVVALAFERLLLCGSLPVAAMALAWGAMAAVGAGQAPFYLAVLLVGAPRTGARPACRALLVILTAAWKLGQRVCLCRGAAAGARSGPFGAPPACLRATGLRRRGRPVRAAGAAAGVVVCGRGRAGQGGRVAAAARARRTRDGARGARAGAARARAVLATSARARLRISTVGLALRASISGLAPALQPSRTPATLRGACRHLPALLRAGAGGRRAGGGAGGGPAGGAVCGRIPRRAGAANACVVAAAAGLRAGALPGLPQGAPPAHAGPPHDPAWERTKKCTNYARNGLLHGTCSSAPFHAVGAPATLVPRSDAAGAAVGRGIAPARPGGQGQRQLTRARAACGRTACGGCRCGAHARTRCANCCSCCRSARRWPGWRRAPPRSRAPRRRAPGPDLARAGHALLDSFIQLERRLSRTDCCWRVGLVSCACTRTPRLRSWPLCGVRVGREKNFRGGWMVPQLCLLRDPPGPADPPGPRARRAGSSSARSGSTSSCRRPGATWW